MLAVRYRRVRSSYDRPIGSKRRAQRGAIEDEDNDEYENDGCIRALFRFPLGFSLTHARGRSMKWILLCWFLFVPFVLKAQEANDGKIMLTVILRYDESKTLDEIDDHLAKTGFIKNFPPEGVEIVSYYIVMGVGHVITLRLPPDKLREVNVAFEKGVWSAFRTEFYPTYDYMRIFNDLKQNAPTPQPETTPAPQTTPSPTPTPTPRRTRHRSS